MSTPKPTKPYPPKQPQNSPPPKQPKTHPQKPQPRLSHGYRMKYHAMNKIASRVWRSHGLEDVRTTAAGSIIFRFKTVDQMKGLSLVVSKVRRPLACDEATFICSRLDFARVCVEIDAASPFIHNFSVLTPLSKDPLNIEVEFEWKPTRCAKCRLFAVDLEPLNGKPSHVKVQCGTATQGTSDKSIHAEKSEGHAKADETQVSGHHPVAPRGKSSHDRTVCPSGKDMHPGHATSTKVGKAPLLAGPSQELARQTRTQSESSMNSKPEESHTPIRVSIAKKPDKGKAAIKDIESSEGEEITGKGIHPKGTVNTMASLHSQPCDSEEDFEVDSRQVHSDQNDEETSFMAFATVKKKKGGKKKNKEARRL
ncbi:hypothetical protein OIU85_023140 [Salix viminalis]|uniref:DUF4283 domain-containing protein n=1 Tax=Salix viminalis TaxID=40686 RepID=A0A9Q0U8A7_SALVM|nr:hypothetical protein OIU85_023140 [Salix viminalis]